RVKRLNQELDQMRHVASMSAGKSVSMSNLEVDSVKKSADLGGKVHKDVNDKLLKEAIEKMWRTEARLVTAKDEIHYLKKRNEELKGELFKYRNDLDIIANSRKKADELK
ncbi:hypothetical protein PFISCL1PPCAC_20857, partial [Pristionchus fissidentatus]